MAVARRCQKRWSDREGRKRGHLFSRSAVGCSPTAEPSLVGSLNSFSKNTAHDRGGAGSAGSASSSPRAVTGAIGSHLSLGRLHFSFSDLSSRAAAAVSRLRVWTAALHRGTLRESTGPAAESRGSASLPDACHVQLPE